MLELNIHEKRFGDALILQDIQFSVARGERVALMGPSGVGKSTLLRIIAGLDKSYAGSCTRPQKMSLMFQSPTLLNWRSAVDNLRVFHPEASEESCRHALAAVGLAGKDRFFPNQLSLGQQRRLALARTFLGNVELALLDEAFVSLDEALRDEMIALTLASLEASNSALIIATHSRAEAEAFGAKIYELKGTPARLS